MSFPNRDKCTFFLGDDIRVEEGGKVSIMGLSVNGILQIQKAPGLVPVPAPDAPMIVHSVAFLASFNDGLGDFSVTFQLYKPDGNKVLPTDPPPATAKKNPDGPMNLILKLNAIEVAPGMMKLVVNLNGRPYEFPFEVRVMPQVSGPH
jgi:hypothetical protein